MNHNFAVCSAASVLAGLLLILAAKCADTTPPTVVIVSPSSGETLSQASVQIVVYATDNKAMGKVEFDIDDTLQGTDASGTADTYRYTWDASQESLNTSHSIMAKAYDAANNMSSQTIDVWIGTRGHGGPTHHGSDIRYSQTWYPSGNPHIVDNTIDVNNNAILTILPGCIVKFAGSAELRCGYAGPGAIVAVGKPDTTIRFTSNATSPDAGDWQDVGIYQHATHNPQFRYCTFEYGGQSGLNEGEIYVKGSEVAKVDSCKIWKSGSYGIVFGDAASQLVSFTGDSITSCALYPVLIYPQNVASIGMSNALIGNAHDGVMVHGGTGDSGITASATWLNPGVPYVIAGDLEVDALSRPILTIAPGTTIALWNGVELYCGKSAAGGIIADGVDATPSSRDREHQIRGADAASTGDSGEIVFTSAEASPSPGDWKDVGVYSLAESTVFRNCRFEYGAPSEASEGEVYIAGNKVTKIDDCKIWKSGNYGVVCADDNSGLASFTYDTITSCAGYPIIVYPSWVGAIGAGNLLAGNAAGRDAILVEGGAGASGVKSTTTWSNQGVPYVLNGNVEVSGLGGPVLTIAPSVTIELQSGVEFYCGVDNPGAIVADGSRGQIVFTSARASPSPGDWLDLGFYDKSSAQCTLSYCKIEYGGGNRGDIYIRNTNKPNITNDSVGRSSSWGIYLDGFTFPDSVALRQLNTFYLDSLGDIHRP